MGTGLNPLDSLDPFPFPRISPVVSIKLVHDIVLNLDWIKDKDNPIGRPNQCLKSEGLLLQNGMSIRDIGQLLLSVLNLLLVDVRINRDEVYLQRYVFGVELAWFFFCIKRVTAELDLPRKS